MDATNQAGAVLTCTNPNCNCRLRIETPCPHGDTYTYTCACGHRLELLADNPLADTPA